MSAPLLPLALAFALGAALGLEVRAPFWLVPVGLAGAGLLLVAGRGRSLVGASAGVVLLCALAGWARVALPDPFPPVRGVRPGPAILEGLVAGALEIEGPRTRFPLVLLRTGPVPARSAAGVLPLSVYGPAPRVAPGEHVRITGEVRMREPFRNPGDEPHGSTPRTPRYFATARTTGVEHLPPAAIPWWLRTRLWIHGVIETHLPAVSGALLEGLLIGERRQLPPSLLADFRRAGVFHVLAISGFNVALVAGSAFLLLRLVRLPAPLAAGLALATLIAFAAVVGGQPSVLRATVMGGLFLAAGLLGRESRVWNSLAAALLLLLALDPGSLMEPGLQLSFAATAGLLHLSPWIRARLVPWCPGPIASALAVSAGAQLGVTPVMLIYFGQLSPLGVVANLLVVPLAGLLTTGGLLTLAVATLSEALAHTLFQSLWVLLVALRLVVRAFAALPGAIVYLPPPPSLAVAVAALALLLLPRVRGAAATLGVAALAVAAASATLAAARPDGLARIVVLDVGQGEAILVQAPDGSALLVDTGGGGPGRGDRGERTVVPVLRRLGVRRLAALAITEGTPDHAGGLVGLLEGMPINEVWIPAGSEAASWHGPVAVSGIPRQVLVQGDRRWIGSLLVTVLHPPPAGASEGLLPGGSVREKPLVLRLEWGLFAAVLAGGTGPAEESELLRARQPLQATMLKVSGHGTQRGSTSEFLAVVRPRVAVIPVGARNPYGHPAPVVLARLGAVGATVYRTDLDGAVDVRSDGTRVWVRAWGRPGPPAEHRLREGL
jgi:competence protein ComEC